MEDSSGSFTGSKSNSISKFGANLDFFSNLVLFFLIWRSNLSKTKSIEEYKSSVVSSLLKVIPLVGIVTSTV